MSQWHPCSAEHYGLSFLVDMNMGWGANQLWITERRSGEDKLRVGTLTFEEFEDHTMPEATISNARRDDHLQHLFNALYEAGYRPPKSDPSGEVIQAKDQNLTDLRTILFNQLGIQQ